MFIKNQSLVICDLGCQSYADTLGLQLRLARACTQTKIPDTLLLVEHPPVITFGRAAKINHLLASREELRKRGVELFEITRGGDVTFHGPGQLVGYSIIDLNQRGRDLHHFLRDLEEVLILTLANFDLKAKRVPGFTGVWVNDQKIAAIGVAVKNWITYHGFAFNVNVDLNYFDLIVPCGLQGKQITNLKNLLSRQVSMSEVKLSIVRSFAKVFASGDYGQKLLEYVTLADIEKRLNIVSSGGADKKEVVNAIYSEQNRTLAVRQ